MGREGSASSATYMTVSSEFWRFSVATFLHRGKFLFESGLCDVGPGNSLCALRGLVEGNDHLERN